MWATGILGMDNSALGDTGTPAVVPTSIDGANALNVDGAKALNEKPMKKTKLPPPSSDQEDKKQKEKNKKTTS